MKPTAIKRLLPGVFQRTVTPGSPLEAILEVMAALHEPSDAVINTIESYFNPYHTPEQFVPFLAYWVDLSRFFHAEGIVAGWSELVTPSGLGRLRELIAAAVQLSQWRGTPKGLRLFLETATGIEGFEIDENVVIGHEGRRPFHVKFRIPQAANPYRVLIERIIEQEKPAYVTYEIEMIAES